MDSSGDRILRRRPILPKTTNSSEDDQDLDEDEEKLLDAVDNGEPKKVRDLLLKGVLSTHSKVII